MKYFSDKTKKVYETVEDLENAEVEFDKAHAAEIEAANKKKARAEEIEAAYKELQTAREVYDQEVADAFAKYDKARNHYRELVAAFCKDYNTYHYTISTDNLLKDFFFKNW